MSACTASRRSFTSARSVCTDKSLCSNLPSRTAASNAGRGVGGAGSGVTDVGAGVDAGTGAGPLVVVVEGGGGRVVDVGVVVVGVGSEVVGVCAPTGIASGSTMQHDTTTAPKHPRT